MSPYRDAAHLQAILERVFRRGYTGEETSALLHQRLALAFVITAPDLRARVDGRDGQTAQVSFGPDTADLPADLTFRMDGETAHAFWSGDLNPVAAMAQGRLRVEGSLIRALALAPGLSQMQRAYREEYAALTAGEEGQRAAGGN
ncbi:SCP2 sterol-binding domain-containing protein [Deinococcus sp. YIM 134068]|uniref:SCP2 sterol-binding domain-containing protein n=1 Tax=Deinococcus lichenicola TaxID=3118910 RepID=UPI002F92FCCF